MKPLRIRHQQTVSPTRSSRQRVLKALKIILEHQEDHGCK